MRSSGPNEGGITTIIAEPLTHAAFEAFGEVLRPRPGTEPVTNSSFAAAGQVRGLRGEYAGTDEFEVLDYWPNLARLSPDPLKIGLLKPRVREARVRFLERHVKGTQAFIPLRDDRAVIVVGEPNDIDDPNAMPCVDRLRAFILREGTGVNLRPGTWHWTPFPLSEGTELLILVRQNAAHDDLNYVDLKSTHAAGILVEMPD